MTPKGSGFLLKMRFNVRPNDEGEVGGGVRSVVYLLQEPCACLCTALDILLFEAMANEILH